MALLADPTGQLTFEQVSSPAMAPRFVPFTQQRMRNIDSEFDFWVKIDVENQSSRTHWLLASAYLWLWGFDLYQQQANGIWQKIPHGVSLPRTQWPQDHRKPVHALQLAIGSRQVMYLHIHAYNSELELVLLSPEQLATKEEQETTFNMLYLGLCLGLMAYNLFLSL